MAEKRRIFWPPTEIERVKLCLSFLEHCILSGNENEPGNIALNTGCYNREHDLIQAWFLDNFFLPFFDFLDQQIEEYSSVLYILEKFKLRSQWFERERLLELYKECTPKGETNLDAILRQFLFDNGIEYPFSTPASPSGRADIVASLHTTDPIMVEVKIFDGESRGRGYISRGFRQLHDYMQDFGKNIGYLVIFNVCSKQLQFRLSRTDQPPRVNLNSSTIFLIVVDLFHELLPASKRPKLEIYEIGEDELVTRED